MQNSKSLIHYLDKYSLDRSILAELLDNITDYREKIYVNNDELEEIGDRIELYVFLKYQYKDKAVKVEFLPETPTKYHHDKVIPGEWTYQGDELPSDPIQEKFWKAICQYLNKKYIGVY